MELSRTKNATRNIIFGICYRFVATLGPFAIRTSLLYTLGVEYLGLNSLFTSLLSFLSLAELGIGNAMVYAMYKPIAEETHRVQGRLVHYLSYKTMGAMKNCVIKYCYRGILKAKGRAIYLSPRGRYTGGWILSNL